MEEENTDFWADEVTELIEIVPSLRKRTITLLLVGIFGGLIVTLLVTIVAAAYLL